ncbi:MAG: class I SAM-dependent methyltransferase [Bacteroidota bacterium]
MMEISEIRTQDVKKCLLCEEEGILYYKNLQDRLFDVPGLWNFWKCPNCGLIWLNPRPVVNDIGKTYMTYLTHNIEGSKTRIEILQDKIALLILFSSRLYSNKNKRTISNFISGRFLSLLPLFRNMARRYVMNLYGKPKEMLLDVGCGNGQFLADMRKLDWEVAGVEPDPQAARIAIDKFNLCVFSGTLFQAKYPPNSFDAITMKHVIEHIIDPLELIRECYRILKPGGKLSIITPNAESLQNRLFKSSWFELDPPRHLHLFSLSTTIKLFELAVPAGFQIIDLRSISINSAQVSIGSRAIGSMGKWNPKRLSTWQIMEGVIFWFVEEVMRLFLPKCGEEILMTVMKRSE